VCVCVCVYALHCLVSVAAMSSLATSSPGSTPLGSPVGSALTSEPSAVTDDPRVALAAVATTPAGRSAGARRGLARAESKGVVAGGGAAAVAEASRELNARLVAERSIVAQLRAVNAAQAEALAAREVGRGAPCVRACVRARPCVCAHALLYTYMCA
jgi:hypothetical protein